MRPRIETVSQENCCKLVLEALGKRGNPTSVKNMFNKVSAWSDDVEIRQLCEQAIAVLERHGPSVYHTPIEEMSAGKVLAAKMRRVCETRLGR